MPLLQLDFQPDLLIDPKSKKLGTIYRPYILVKLGYMERWSKNFIRALVDSGADHNVFPADFAKEIGIDYKKGVQWRIAGVGNDNIIVYVSIVKMRIDKREFETIVQFGEGISIPLLGREGFFNYFDRITINVKRRLLELKY